MYDLIKNKHTISINIDRYKSLSGILTLTKFNHGSILMKPSHMLVHSDNMKLLGEAVYALIKKEIPINNNAIQLELQSMIASTPTDNIGKLKLIAGVLKLLD